MGLRYKCSFLIGPFIIIRTHMTSASSCLAGERCAIRLQGCRGSMVLLHPGRFDRNAFLSLESNGTPLFELKIQDTSQPGNPIISVCTFLL